MERIFVVLVLIGATSAMFHKVELSDEKTPYDYVKERLDALGMDKGTGVPISHSYEVEESEDYPENIEGAASSVLNTGVNVGGLGYGSNLGLGVGLGHGLGVGGVGGVGVGGLGLGGYGAFGPGAINAAGVGGIGIGNGIGLYNPGLGGIGVGQLGGGLLYNPYHGAQIGGGFVDKKAYDEEQKKGADQNIEKLEKQAEGLIKSGQEGYQANSAIANGEKGDSSFYKGEEAKKKAIGDEKYYEGGQQFDKKGANEEIHKTGKSHKKGHVSKGFKTSSSKNEEEKSESYYDEAHDEADHKIAGQNLGSFGENSQQGFKGAHEEKILDANAAGKEGHHVSGHKFDDTKGNKGEFLQKDYKGGAEQLEKFNNLGAHSIHGHQEASGGYQQSKGILPIHRRR